MAGLALHGTFTGIVLTYINGLIVEQRKEVAGRSNSFEMLQKLERLSCYIQILRSDCDYKLLTLFLVHTGQIISQV